MARVGATLDCLSLITTLRPEEEHEELEDEPEAENNEDIHNTAILEDDEENENDEFNADVSITSRAIGPFTCPGMVPMSTPNVTNETMTSFFINLTSASQSSSRDYILPTPPRPPSPDQLVPSRLDSESEPDSPIIKSRSSRITDSD